METLSDKIMHPRVSCIYGELGVGHLKKILKNCFKKMEKKLELNKIKYSDVVRIIKQEFGKELI